MHFLKEEADNPKCNQKKVVLISDLGCKASEDKLDVILENLKMEGIEFTFM